MSCPESKWSASWAPWKACICRTTYEGPPECLSTRGSDHKHSHDNGSSSSGRRYRSLFVMASGQMQNSVSLLHELANDRSLFFCGKCAALGKVMRYISNYVVLIGWPDNMPPHCLLLNKQSPKKPPKQKLPRARVVSFRSNPEHVAENDAERNARGLTDETCTLTSFFDWTTELPSLDKWLRG